MFKRFYVSIWRHCQRTREAAILRDPNNFSYSHISRIRPQLPEKHGNIPASISIYFQLLHLGIRWMGMMSKLWASRSWQRGSDLARWKK